MRHLLFFPAAILAGLALVVLALAGSSHTAEANDCDGAPDIAIGNVTEQMLSDAGLTGDDIPEIEFRLFEKGGIALVINTPDEPGGSIFLENDQPLDPGDLPGWSPEYGPAFSTFCFAEAPELLSADSDEDGVDDFHDRCPDTPAGMPVGANGCPDG